MHVEHFMLAEHDWLPNNPFLPVLVYCKGLTETGKRAAPKFEEIFAAHGWPPAWRDGVFDYHHYHSTAHEALGVASGSARLLLGGPGGRELSVTAGDALVLPVGTGHCCLSASADFLVVGAYPQGQQWDICRDAPSHDAWQRICSLPVPTQDPVTGRRGLLLRLWH